MNFSKTSLQNYLKLLGSDAPAPGGGSAAALVGAAGSALAEMVARINSKKTPESRKSAKTAEAAGKKLLALITKDAQAFEKIKKAFRKDRESREYQQALKTGAAT